MDLLHRKSQILKSVFGASALMLMLFLTSLGRASVSGIHHDLQLKLYPERHLLIGMDQMKVKISGGVEKRTVSLRDADYIFLD